MIEAKRLNDLLSNLEWSKRNRLRELNEEREEILEDLKEVLYLRNNVNDYLIDNSETIIEEALDTKKISPLDMERMGNYRRLRSILEEKKD